MVRCTVCASSCRLQNVAIYIIESHEDFAGETLIEPHLAKHIETTTVKKFMTHLRK